MTGAGGQTGVLRHSHLWELIAARAALTPDRHVAVDDGDRTLTFSQYRDQCERVAAGLAERGVVDGTRVSWQLPSWFESLVLIGALARLGAVQNPMLPIYREREMRFIATQFRPALWIVPSQWRGFDYEGAARGIAHELRDAEGDEPQIVVINRGGTLPDGDPASLPPYVAHDATTTRWVFYTSGTTADPKGVRHSDATLIAAGLGVIDRTAITEDDISAMVFPITHVGGVLSLLESMATGSGFVVIEAFDPATSIPVLSRAGTSLVGAGTPFCLAYLAAQRAQPDVPLFPRARMFPSGGMPKPPELFFEVKRELGGAGMVSGYGMTECPVFCMNDPRDAEPVLATTEGRPAGGAELRIVRLDGDIAAPGEEGELRLKGPQRFLGYLDPALDVDAFDADGWFRTGDLGTVDPDGHVRITGRVKDIIIRKGENISAQEVENYAYQHPKVSDVAVIGLPDPASGERVCAVVVPVDAGDPPSLGELTSFLEAEGLMRQKLPEQLEVVVELPRNPTGKVLKHELRAHFTGT